MAVMASGKWRMAQPGWMHKCLKLRLQRNATVSVAAA